MFRERLLTTLVLVPLVLMVIYWGPLWLFSGILMALILVCGWEWTQLIPIKRGEYRYLYLFAILLVIIVTKPWMHGVLILSLVMWLFIFIAILTYPKSQSIWGYPWIIAALGLLLLPLFFNVFIALHRHPHGSNLMVYALCLIWAADIGAYVLGRRIGRHPLIPSVSPGKTLEGLCGGLALALLISGIAYWMFRPGNKSDWFLWAGLVVFISVIGDLLISLLKRRVKLKDTGHILPGHGGFLDRLDSAIAAIPLFYFAISYLTLRY